MRMNQNIPVAVYAKAHAEYPKAVGAKRLYGCAFFGHGRPRDLDHKETTESIWRGLVRRCLREYAAARA